MAQTSDVVVVGAGIVGCAAAYELARRGARVRVIERRDVGRGATQASAGVLAPHLEAHAGLPLVDLGARSLDLYDEFVARVVEDSGAAVEYARNGTLEIAADGAGLSRLEAAGRAWRARGVPVELLDAAAVREAEPQLAGGVVGGLLVRSHGFVGATDLAAALQRAAVAHGVAFVPATTVARVVRRGAGLDVETGGDATACGRVVLAAGSWSGQVEVDGAEAVPVRPVRGQLLRLGWTAPRLARVVWASRCYLVPWTDGSVLAGATVEDVGFDERVTVAGVRELLDTAQRMVPAVGAAWFHEARVGLRPATPDELPVIGPSARLPGLVYATGHYRNGILLAPLTAALVAGLILDDAVDPALEVTTPARFAGA